MDYDGDYINNTVIPGDARGLIGRIRRYATRLASEAAADMRQRKDDAYEERNQVVAALSKLFPSGVARTDISGWSDDWHGCVYIDFPTGQVSWHFHDSQAHYFEHLPPYKSSWDGHDTAEKYRRLGALPLIPDGASEGRGGGWRPIAEAPKDGTVIIGQWRSGEVFRAQWQTAEYVASLPKESGNPDDYTSEWFDIDSDQPRTPAWWMPLLSPPPAEGG